MNDNVARFKYGSLYSVVVVSAVAVFIWPVWRHHAQIDADIAAMHHRLAQADSEADLVARAQERLDSIRRRVEQELKPIPQRGDVPGLITAISADIEDLGLKRQTFSTGRESAARSSRRFDLKLDTSGPFSSVFELIRRIEALPRLVRIDQVTIESADALGSGQVKAGLTINAYYRTAEAPPAQPPGQE